MIKIAGRVIDIVGVRDRDSWEKRIDRSLSWQGFLERTGKRDRDS